MSFIWSQKAVAQSVATGFDNTLQSLSSKEIELAEQTTVNGNIIAKETVAEEQEVVQSFVSAMQKDIERIRSVAIEFEKVDDSLQLNFQNYRW